MPDYGYLLPTRGIVLSSEDEDTLAAKAQSDVVGLATRAEAMGFGSVWAGDSVLAKPRLEPLSTLAAVATATRGVDLGTAVYLPPLRDPVHVAHLTSTLDQLSGGRFAFGVGVGIGPDVEAEYANLDVPFRERGPRLSELLEVVTELWTGEPVDFDGRFYDLEDASIGFGPIGKPPVYVPTAAFDPTEGFPGPIRDRLVEHGDGWLPINVSPEAYETSLAAIRGFLEEAGRDTATFDPALYVDAVIDEDEVAAIDRAREFYDRYYPAWGTLSDEQVRGHGAFGPPAHVAERLEAYAEAGVETMLVRFTTPRQREQLRRFEDVVDLG
jgi:alkanesulfonate monooxygenase SsuD/methylene tetrahydromethanopterin reductase-like flavin-dependent oxidoreductase (luciferase family)